MAWGENISTMKINTFGNLSLVVLLPINHSLLETGRVCKLEVVSDLALIRTEIAKFGLFYIGYSLGRDYQGSR